MTTAQKIIDKLNYLASSGVRGGIEVAIWTEIAELSIAATKSEMEGMGYDKRDITKQIEKLIKA